jgi:hypothetical protein
VLGVQPSTQLPVTAQENAARARLGHFRNMAYSVVLSRRPLPPAAVSSLLLLTPSRCQPISRQSSPPWQQQRRQPAARGGDSTSEPYRRVPRGAGGLWGSTAAAAAGVQMRAGKDDPVTRATVLRVGWLVFLKRDPMTYLLSTHCGQGLDIANFLPKQAALSRADASRDSQPPLKSCQPHRRQLTWAQRHLSKPRPRNAQVMLLPNSICRRVQCAPAPSSRPPATRDATQGHPNPGPSEPTQPPTHLMTAPSNALHAACALQRHSPGACLAGIFWQLHQCFPPPWPLP